MELQEIIQQLKTIEDSQLFPYAAVEEAVRQREAITPILLQELENCYRNILENGTESVYEDLSLYAMYLLSQFREKRAFPKLLQLMALDEEAVDFFFGDIATEDLPSMLYSTFPGDLEALTEFVSNKDHCDVSRSAALRVLPALYCDGVISRDWLVGFLRQEMERAEREEEFVPDCLARAAEELHLFEMTEDVREMFLQNKIDLQMAGDFADALDYFYDYDGVRDKTRILTDAAKELSSWPMFEQTKKWLSPEELRERLKTGRNAPCPCGSGKKYKKCCLREDEQRLLFFERMDPPDWTPRDMYPAWESASSDRPGLLAHYDRAALEVDKPAYRGMKLAERGEFLEGNHSGSRKQGLRNLLDAFTRFQMLCQQEKITSLEEFDRRYKVHYLCGEWLGTLLELLKEFHDPRVAEVEETLARMSGSSAE